MTINQCNATYNKLMNLIVEVSSGNAKMSLLHVRSWNYIHEIQNIEPKPIFFRHL